MGTLRKYYMRLCLKSPDLRVYYLTVSQLWQS